MHGIRTAQFGCTAHPPPAAGFAPVDHLTAFIGRGEFRDRQQSFGLFGEATVEPFPRLSVTAGLRYQRDHQDRQDRLGRAVFQQSSISIKASLLGFQS